jgi:tetratricopeptide (TPR) repeat protein
MKSGKFSLIQILITSCFLLIFLPTFADFNYNVNCRKAFRLVVSLRFDEAKKIIAFEKTLNPSNGIPFFLDNYIDFLTIAIGQENGKYEALIHSKSLRIDKITNSGKKSPYNKYCLAEIYLQWAVLRLFISGNEIGLWEGIGTALDINKVNNLIESNIKEYPNFMPNKMCLAVLHAISGSITDEYSWARYVIPFNGNVLQSVNELKEVLDYSLKNENYSYLTEECLLYLTFIQLNLSSNKHTALDLLNYYNDTSVKETVRTNPLLVYAKAAIFSKNGMNDSALNLFRSVPSGNQYFPFYQMDFAYGKALINKLDDKASLYFFKYILNFKGIRLLKTSMQQIAWQYLMDNNLLKYKEYMNKCLSTGNPAMESDRMANNEALSGKSPDIVLLKARLLCDGGYYEKSLAVLKDFSIPLKTRSKRDTIEYLYRLGRIYHEWGKSQAAVIYYEKCISASKGTIYYFAMNASYQLGLIYENQKDFKKAKYFYERCLSMDADEYKKGIRQKARIALKRIAQK